MNIPKRFRNAYFIGGMISLIMLTLKTFFNIDAPAGFDGWVDAFLGFLGMLGVYVDPTTPGLQDKP